MGSPIHKPWIIPIRSPKFILLIIAFVGVSVLVRSGLTSEVDDSISIHFKAAQESDTLNLIMIASTFLGDISSLLIIAIALTIVRRTRKIGMIFLIVILIIVISTLYIKVIIGRHIPPYSFIPPKISKNTIIEEDSLAPLAKNLSYPSSHVAVASSMAYIIGFKLNQRSRWLGLIIWFFAVIMAISRLYIMQHYLTDVVAGFLFGIIVSVVMSNIMHLELPPPSTAKFEQKKNKDRSMKV